MPPPEIKTPPPSVPASEKGERGGSSDHYRRLCRYGTARAVTNELLAYITDEQLLSAGIKNPERVRHCGSWTRFNHYFTVDEWKLSGANFCDKHLLCGLCAILRGSKLLRLYLERLQSVQAKNPDLVPVMVTPTIRNGPDLSERYAHLKHALKILHARRHRKNQPSVMHEVAGGVYSIEVTENGNGWHPHPHAIWLVDRNHPAATDSTNWALKELSPEWHRITGDSFIVDARPIRPNQDDPFQNPYADGFCEVFKYAMKAGELGPAKTLEAYPVLAGSRMVGSFGAFFGIKEPKSLLDDLTDYKNLSYFEYMYRFMHGKYHLAKEPVYIASIAERCAA